ncbi:MAG: PAS domain S-box protein, partial [Thermoplasmata archaeon]|nr:PAS domain S-box protein [Thermoplasmata archaeon]
LLRKDGTTYPVIVYSNPIMHKDKAVGLRGVVVDITERKRIENALRESDGNLRNILESSPDAIIVTNMKGRIVECNRSSLNVFGCSTKSELIGKNGLDMLAPNERQRGEEALKMTLEEGYSMTKEQICMTTDGHEFPAEVSAGALRDLSNRPIGFVTTIKDISQRTKAEEELLQSQKLASIGQLAAGVAHEINTPLTNISLMTENLMKRTNDPEIMGKLKGISEQQMFAANIVKDLLSFSRKTTPEIKNVNLNDAVAGSISLLKEQMPELIKIIKDFQPDMPDIKADPEQLQRVFTNIIDNAVDAMPKGGKLTIATAKKNNGCVEMRFMDTGTGIPREDIGRVFDPFFTKKSGQLGTGLGLSICHGIVRAHNGTIEVESEEGKGTTFIINLPVI